MSFPEHWLQLIKESGIPLQTISLQMGWRKQRLHQLVKPNRTYRLREGEYKKLLPYITQLEEESDKKKPTPD
jgi:hypothetical protein